MSDVGIFLVQRSRSHHGSYIIVIDEELNIVFCGDGVIEVNDERAIVAEEHGFKFVEY